MLNDMDKSGRVELMLYENAELNIRTDKEEIMPKIEAIMAREFPHKFDNLSFLLKIKAPNAPAANSSNEIKKQFNDVFASGIST
jgi:hypothetical protein